jgi:hypothetical protein
MDDQPWKQEAIALSEARDSTQKAAEQRKPSWDESQQSKGEVRRTLYTANVGDARAVLWFAIFSSSFLNDLTELTDISYALVSWAQSRN